VQYAAGLLSAAAPLKGLKMRSLTRLLTAAVLTASAAVAMAQDLPQTSVTPPAKVVPK